MSLDETDRTLNKTNRYPLYLDLMMNLGIFSFALPIALWSGPLLTGLNGQMTDFHINIYKQEVSYTQEAKRALR